MTIPAAGLKGSDPSLTARGDARFWRICVALFLGGFATFALPYCVQPGLVTAGFFGGHSIASSRVGWRAGTARAQASALYLFFYYLGSSLAGWIGGLILARRAGRASPLLSEPSPCSPFWSRCALRASRRRPI